MNDQLSAFAAAMASSSTNQPQDLAALFAAQQQLLSGAMAAQSSANAQAQNAQAIQASASSASTSPLLQQHHAQLMSQMGQVQGQGQGQQMMMPVGLKQQQQMVMTSSAPPSQKPSFSLA